MPVNVFFKVFAFYAVFWIVAVKAEDPKALNDAALAQTQELLNDVEKRKATMANSKEASDLDRKIFELTKGSEALSQGVYSLSGDVMSQLVVQTDGDADKLQALIEKAKNDPKAFYDSLSPELKEKMRGLASQIEAKNPAPKN